MKKVIHLIFLIVITLSASYGSAWADDDTVNNKNVDLSTAREASGYVAKNESIQYLFNAVSSEAKRPYILSKLAQKKVVTGDFDISSPTKFLEKISNVIGLAWYDDGQTVYIYDNNELKNSVVMLRYTTINALNDFLRQTGLATARYPIRGEQKNNVFYVAGPPAYVDIVVNAAAYLEDLYKNVDLNKQRISIIKLHNTFVNDRKMKVRDQDIIVPGIGNVIQTILSNDRKELVTIDAKSSIASGNIGDNRDNTNENMKGNIKENPVSNMTEKKSVNDNSQIKVISYPDTNSLLVKGTQEQIDLIQILVDQLDIPKRHIELSLWIIDISKNDLDKLGVDWQGALTVGSKTQVTLNASTTSTSTLNGNQFLAQISALSSKGMAEIVSRPIILTQDNVPASFDHNNTLYAKLQAERVANLQAVTYGTLINVLPRFSPKGDEIEMVLDIEDGQQQASATPVDGIPVITRTKLSTIARVPKDKSLLVGGYTLDQYSNTKNKIPFLGDIPYIGGAFRSDSETVTKMVRVFLIQPKILEIGASWDPDKFKETESQLPDVPLSDTLDMLKKYSKVNNVPN